MGAETIVAVGTGLLLAVYPAYRLAIYGVARGLYNDGKIDQKPTFSAHQACLKDT